MKLIVSEKSYSICRFKIGSVLPDWIYSSDFYSITKTRDELSVVTHQTDHISEEIVCNRDWRILKIAGPLDFSLSGVISGITDILREKNISVFVISTYDTDYVLVKQENLDSAMKALTERGYDVLCE